MANKNKKAKPLMCIDCELKITKLQFKIQCAGTCAGWFHKSCSGLDEEEFTKYELRKMPSKWACVNCSEHEDNPRQEQQNPTGRKSGVFRGSFSGQSGGFERQMAEVQSFETLLDISSPTNADILKGIKKMYDELKQSVTFNGTMMEEMKNDMQRIIEDNKKLRREQELLKNRVIELEKEMIHIKGTSEVGNIRNKNIVIMGLKGDGNSRTDVLKTFDALRLNPSENEFDIKVLPSQGTAKPVLVTFKEQTLRDEVLRRRRDIPLNTETCQISSDTKRNIYINPDLSRHTRELFLKAKELKSYGFKYVWCKDDNILVRKRDGDPVTRIITSAQIESLKI